MRGLSSVILFPLLAFGATLSAAPRTVKIGIGRVFPISYRATDGKLVGFAIDVLNEAAAREKIAIEWMAIQSSQASEQDLRAGKIDLLPAAMVTAERQQAFYVSEPWWATET